MQLDLPSRYGNPFATCWTRPGALDFIFPPGQSAEQLVARLAAANWRGEIVGPHGSGKSTLLETLKPHFAAAGRCVAHFTLRAGQRRLPWDRISTALASSLPLMIIDGYEQLAPLGRALLRFRCRRASAGLLVTAHTPTGLPRIATLAPTIELVNELVDTLTERVATPLTADDVAAGFACHGSNVRALWFDLHALHERYRRRARTRSATHA